VVDNKNLLATNCAGGGTHLILSSGKTYSTATKLRWGIQTYKFVNYPFSINQECPS
jgi:hypothetical protein